MITYINGDATDPIDVEDGGDESKFILHICNDINRWGKGFVLAVSKRWPEAAKTYHKMEMKLGNICIVNVEKNIYVVNMIAQHNIRSTFIKSMVTPPIRYDALQECLKKVVEFINSEQPNTCVSIHMPRIGCGLAGGKWEEVQKIIEVELKDFNVVVYDLPK